MDRQNRIHRQATRPAPSRKRSTAISTSDYIPPPLAQAPTPHPSARTISISVSELPLFAQACSAIYRGDHTVRLEITIHVPPRAPGQQIYHTPAGMVIGDAQPYVFQADTRFPLRPPVNIASPPHYFHLNGNEFWGAQTTPSWAYSSWGTPPLCRWDYSPTDHWTSSVGSQYRSARANPDPHPTPAAFCR